MLEHIEAALQRPNFIAFVILFLWGFFIMVAHPNLVKKLIGMYLVQTSVIFLLVTAPAIAFRSTGRRLLIWSEEISTLSTPYLSLARLMNSGRSSAFPRMRRKLLELIANCIRTLLAARASFVASGAFRNYSSPYRPYIYSIYYAALSRYKWHKQRFRNRASPDGQKGRNPSMEGADPRKTQAEEIRTRF